ncbi:MAG: glycosyltransferase family 61 protein [candidate division SR1 bacterium]|nr:glycosyltransferase family 61 protein [candidate division SR1 bacterium]
MTRKIKELFIKYVRSHLLWKAAIFLAKIYHHCIKIFRIFSFGQFQFGPPSVRDKPTKQRYERYNTNVVSAKKAIYKEIYPPNQVNKKLPKTIEKRIHPTLLKYISEPQHEQFVVNIPEGKVIGTYTNITPDYKILRDSAGYKGFNTDTNYYTYKIYLGKATKIHENLAVLSGDDTFKNYHHRLIFGLPKYHLFQKSGFKIDKYITDYSFPFHKEAINALGIKEEQIIIAKKTAYIEAENLILGSTTTIHGNIPKRAIDFLKNTFLEDHKPKKTGKRLYISRITNRKVINDEEISSYLHKFGFIKYDSLDNLSIKEQAELFNSAEIIIGIHGAALTNAVFCKEGTKIIEIFHEKTVRGHYYCIANACELDYYYLLGKSIKDNRKMEMDRDMYIPIEKIIKTLELAGIK